MNYLANHLWQSTIFAIAIAALCWLLRHHSPRLRYRLLLSASLKFLIPFSVFVAIGGKLQSPGPEPLFTASAVEQASAAFSPIPASSRPSPSHEVPWIPFLWSAGMIAVFTWRANQWRRVRKIRNSATPISADFPVPVLETPTLFEPGIVGVFRSVLVIPKGLFAPDGLTPEQRKAVLAHERCHLRYRDNFTAAIHMGIETIFWFHPLVWWIGVRLMDERERHCDETVVATGIDAQVYAQSIVTVCRKYLSSPLPCAAGITGSDLKRRIVGIMTHRASRQLTGAGKAALTAATIAVISVPFVIGALRAQVLPPPSTFHFEAASIHPSKAPDQTNRLGPTPQGGLRGENVNVVQLIALAYGVRPFLIVDAPGWASSERFDILATPDPAEDPLPAGASREAQRERLGQRLQSLLRSRFGLVIRAEKRPMPVYQLLIAKGGHKMTASKEGEARRMESNSMMLRGTAVDMKTAVDSLSGILQQPVLDETNLSGSFNFSLQFADVRLQDTADANTAPTLFSAITEQLGLKLESTRAPAPVFVVEKVNRPTEN